MSSQPSDTKPINTEQASPEPEAVSEEISDAERLQEISAYWKSVKNPGPQPGGYHRGIYIPPNGPPGTFYIGYGKVVETGLNSQGGVYVWVIPPWWGEYKYSELYDFTNPNKKECAGLERYHRPKIPLDRDMPDELMFGFLSWPSAEPKPDTRELERSEERVSLGDEAFGYHMSYREQHYEGVGRVVHDKNAGSYRQPRDGLYVVPIADRQGKGVYRFFHAFTRSEIPYMDLPSAVKLTPAQRKRWRRTIRSRKPGRSPGFENDRCARPAPFPELGTEARGAYLAPDGQWYRGRGKAVAFGLSDLGTHYILVEPIPGKEGGEYDFFHPATKEFMPKFPEFPTAAEVYPWREHFKKPVSELVPGLEDAVC
ncbi:hypothetical protein BJY00DRAFT_317520 [Aspergillus carlsbadensis]|nr:hypothetical protein BJY00DRAFT_317520 [Aspergillus carlsbadensis]